jgi:hypothetical protein
MFLARTSPNGEVCEPRILYLHHLFGGEVTIVGRKKRGRVA